MKEAQSGDEPSDRLRDLLERNEEIRWYGRPEKQNGLRAVSYLFIVLSALPLWLTFEILGQVVFGDVRTTRAVGAAVVVGFSLVALLYLALERRHGWLEYAVTDRRVIRSKGWVRRSFEWLEWENVKSVEFPAGGYTLIRVAPSVSEGDTRILPERVGRRVSAVRFRWFDGHEAYEPMLQAWVEATGGPEEAKTVGDDERWSSGLEAVSNEAESLLNTDERVVWRSNAETGAQTGVVVFGMLVLGIFTFVVTLLVVGVVYPLFFQPMSVPTALLTSVVVAAVSMVVLYRAQNRWNESIEYVVTDERAVQCMGKDCFDLPWEEVEAVQRRGRSVVFYTEDPAEMETTTRGGGHLTGASYEIKTPDLSFSKLPSSKDAYWKIRRVWRNERDE